jgi:predicted DsbA family dithiol-disulfide isomerase
LATHASTAKTTRTGSLASDLQVRIDVWSDYVCPFCCLEMPVTDELQREFGEVLRIEWHAYELRPAPAPMPDPAGEYLHSTWESSVYPMAKRRAMTLRLPPLQPRSRKALEAAEFARAHDTFEPMHRALFAAFFQEGRNIGKLAELADIGESVGLDPDALEACLKANRYAAAVLADQALARELGVTAVPALLLRRADEPIRNARVVSGAASYEQLRQAVSRLIDAS